MITASAVASLVIGPRNVPKMKVVEEKADIATAVPTIVEVAILVALTADQMSATPVGSLVMLLVNVKTM